MAEDIIFQGEKNARATINKNKKWKQGMKMNKLAILLALSSAFVTPAFAETEKGVNITATVGSFCQLSSALGGTDSSVAIKLGVATNGSHAGVADAGGTTRSMHLLCNQPFVVNLVSEQGAVRRMSDVNGGAGPDTPVLGGVIAKAIAYSATPSLTDLDTSLFAPTYSTLIANADLNLGTAPSEQRAALNAVVTGDGVSSGGAYNGTLEIGIVTEASPTLVAGAYRDTLTVVLVAQ